MITAIPDQEIKQLLIHQIGSLFTINETEKNEIESVYSSVMDKVYRCFMHSENKYFKRKIGETNNVYFNPFHSVQYCIFLYIYSRTIYIDKKDGILADKLYYLNRSLNSCDLFYAIELPTYWGCEHPLGSIMGRGEYGDGFFFYQCCTVGGNTKLEYPIIGKNVRMYSHSQLIGNCHIGDDVLVGANCLVKDQDVPSKSIVFGQSPNLIIKSRKDI
jgi:serine O-acetyltransferase